MANTLIATLTGATFVVDTIVPPVIEAADCTVSGSNTAAATFAVSHPAASAGDLLIFYVAWDDSTATTDVAEPAGPNGETLTECNATPVTDGLTETRAKAWYTVATGSWSASTRTFTPTATESWSATVVRIPAGEFDAATPMGAVGTSSDAGGGTDTTVDSPAFSAGASDGDGTLLWFASVDADPLGGTNPTGWTILQAQDLGAVAHGVAKRNTAVTDSESIASATWAIAGDSWTSIAVIVRAPTTSPFADARQAGINGLDSAQSEAAGFDALRSSISVSALVRTSDSVATLTLPALASYVITADETLTWTLPGTLLAGGSPIVATPTVTVSNQSGADTTAPTLSAQIVGTLTTVGGIPAVTTDEGNGTAYMVVVPNGDTPSVTQIKAGQNSSGGAALASANQAVSATGVQTFSAVSGLSSNTPYDAWFVHTDAASNNSTAVKADFATVFAFNDARQAIIDGLDSAQSEAAGWDALRASIPVSAVVRTSGTVVTITLPALASYSITADETITATVPASAVVGNAPIVATPTIAVTNETASGVNGVLDQPLGALTLVSTGTVDVAGQVAVTLGSLTSSATGTVDIQGTFTQMLGVLTSAATGTVEVAGTLTATLATLTVASAGTVDIAGTLTQTLGALTSDAQGVVGDAPIEGVLDQALGALTVVATGTVDVLGVASPPLGALTVIAAGTVDVQGVLTQTLAPATLASAGQAEITATLAVTLADATVVSTGTVADGIPVLGDLTQALGTLTAVATGTVEVSGALTQDLGSLSLAGVATAEIAGVAALTLGPLTSTATGTVDVVGALTQTLGVIQVQSDGVVGDPPIQGELSQALGVLTVVGTGQAEISAVATPPLGALTLVATLTTEIQGAAAPTLGALTSTGTGTVALSGQAAISLGDLVGALTGAVEVHGVLAVTLEALTVVPETLWQPVARPGTLYTTRLGGTRTGTRITASHTHTELTEAA